MKTEDFINDIFIALFVVVFIKIFDAFFSLYSLAWHDHALTGFFYVFLLILILASILLAYPKLLNLKNEELKLYLKRFVIWGWIIWFFLFFAVLLISTCRMGGFPGLSFCAQNITQINP